MATTPFKLGLTRDQLALFLQDHEQIKQFENLFALVGQEVAPNSVTEATILAGSADARAQQALDSISRMTNALEALATAPVAENNNSVTTDYIDFDPAPPHVDRARRMAWNSVDQTLDLGMDYGVIQQIGEEVYARVGNTTGSTIPNGTVVGFAGATSDALLVTPYLADGSQPSLYILGVMTHDLPDSGEKGYCTTWGFVRGLDTSAFSQGDLLYASPSTAGAFTNVKPTAPDNVIPLAACIVSDATDGVIFVRPTIEQQQYYGDFARTTSSTAAAANTAYAIEFDTTNVSNGISIGSPTSRIVAANAGLYQFDVTFQFTSTNASLKNAWVWWRKNGTDVVRSSFISSLADNNGNLAVSRSDFFSLANGDYIEVMWAVDDTAMSLNATAATAFAPASPSVVLTVTQVQQ